MQCERLKGNGNIYTSVHHYVMYPWKMYPSFLSKATGSNGAFCWVAHCIPLTKNRCNAASKPCELRKCQGNGKVLESCVPCFAGVQVCEERI